MAMYDWNHNGENDMQDDYLEYMIYKDCTNDNNSNANHSSYNSDSAFGINVFVVIAVIAIFAFIGNAMEESTPKCIKPGCNNEQAKTAVTATCISRIQVDQQVVHHITAARVLMIHMMKDMMISI